MLNDIFRNCYGKKDSYTWKIYGLVVVVLCIVPAFLHGQEKDFTTWASAGFKYKVKPAFTLSGKLEWRTKDDLGKTDRWGLDVGGAYSVLPFLKVAAVTKSITAIVEKPVGNSVTVIILTERFPRVYKD